MQQDEFKNIVSKTATKLLESGYQIQKEEPFYEAEFWRKLVTGVYCLVGFDFFKLQ